MLTAISIYSRQFQFYSQQFQFAHGNFNFTHGNFNLLTAISIYSGQFQFAHGNFNLFRAISICSQQFQFYSRQFQFAHGNFNLFRAISILLTAISICSRQFQFTHGNFNLLTAISILLTAISIYSGQFRNFTPKEISIFHGNAHGIFHVSHHLSSTATVATHQKSKRKIKSEYLKLIFKEKSENHKSKVDLRTSRTRGYLHETGTNSDWYEFVSVAIHFLPCVY